MKLNLSRLLPTASVDFDKVESYASQKSEFPPIEVLKRKREDMKWWIVDGHHRTMAAIKRGDTEIEVFESTRENWILENLRKIFNR